VAARESRLPETLTALIADRGIPRRTIADALGLSTTALSQYTRGTSQPSLTNLIALADYFGIGLDELVFGTSSLVESAPHAAVIRTVQDAVSRTQAMTAAHTALVARIARELGAKKATDQTLLGTEVVEGLVVDEEIIRLEARARRADVVTLDLDANVIKMSDGETVPGKFLEVVAVAISRGCRYRFVVSSTPRTSDASISGFLELLGERIGADEAAARCEIRRATIPTMLGMGLYQIDTALLLAEDPSIHQQFATAIDDDGWFGYVMRPLYAAGKDSVMQTRRRDTARALFDTLWTTGTPVR
jgi:transcriptional regulator with XRE-family HTH domain